ncbi:MAG: tetratricopeptide repeat protein [Planctomycetota bacterium]
MTLDTPMPGWAPGLCKAKLGDLDDAIAAVEQVVQEDPDNPMAWEYLGQL